MTKNIQLGIDNTTAIKAINEMYYKYDHEIMTSLYNLREREKTVVVRATYVNTRIIPADDLTRDKAIDKNKMDAARTMLKSAIQDFDPLGTAHDI